MTRYDRTALDLLVKARRGAGEGIGDGAFLTFTVRITPELLRALLDGKFTTRDGHTATFAGVIVDSDGTASPLIESWDGASHGAGVSS